MKVKSHDGEIFPDEIFIDAHNMPIFDTQQFEGRIERAISAQSIYFLTGLFFVALLMLSGKLFSIQIHSGEQYLNRSMRNTLRFFPVLSLRSPIKDREGTLLAWSKGYDRQYIQNPGFSHLLGYMGRPTSLSSAASSTLFITASTTVGIDGIERLYETALSGVPGMEVVEIDAHGVIQSESVRIEPEPGAPLTLSIDARIQGQLQQVIEQVSHDHGYRGGAGAIMDVHTGELLALTSFPEYSSNSMTSGKDQKIIQQFLQDKRTPFLDRAISGLYTPGSIIKPFMALGALEAGVIKPETKIFSSGQLVLENKYDATKQSIFKDWKAHGWVDMREAIAVSSDEYFYQVGGGYKEQKGMGIDTIGKYADLFGFGHETGIGLGAEGVGTVPSIVWKAKNFHGDAWRVGDTYHTVIGQYGFQVTPIQVVRAVAVIATNGVMVTPTVLNPAHESRSSAQIILPIKKEYFDVVKEGMRLAVNSPKGTGKGLNVDYLNIAAKTGTAEVGITRSQVNSWVMGYFPYESPRYAFAVVMEAGDRHNTVGALYVMRQLFDWMFWNTPEYMKGI